MNRRRWLAREILVFLLTFCFSVFLTPTAVTYEKISYSQFMKLLEEKDIDKIQYCDSEKYALIHQTSENTTFQLGIVSLENFEQDVFGYSLSQMDFEYESFVPAKEVNGFTYFIEVVLLNIFIRIIIKCISWLIRFLQSKKSHVPDSSDDNKSAITTKIKMSFGNYQPRKVSTDIKFSDVIGLEKQIDDFLDIVRFLKEPEKYEEIGAQLPKGILLYGKPGVGKTYIARAIAGEANVSFYETSASELQSKYLGESEERIRNIFEEAQQNAPAIIYLDEIDSIATQRYSENSNKYAASIVNQLLACMDGFSSDSRVIVIAATNHVGTLDEALLRPGRFDRKIYIHEPDKDARKKLIEYYSKDKCMDDTLDIDRIVDITSGLTGADIKTILNEAALLSVRKGETFITEEVLMEAFRKVEIGSENNFTSISKENLKRTAVHEAGHAVVTHYFNNPVSEISIIPRGKAAGYNLVPQNDDANYTFQELKTRILCLLGGRAAEEVVYSEVSAGASDDLKRASTMIKDMFLRFSMKGTTDVSMVLTDDKKFDELIVNSSYEDMETFMRKCYQETVEIISNNLDKLNRLTEELVKKEILSQREIENILK